MSEPLNNLKALAAPAELRRAPVVEGNQGLGWLTDKLAAFAEGKTPLWWWILFIPAVTCAGVLLPAMLVYQVTTGVGVWGNNHPVMWGLDIVNFIWWVGVAHAGTLISALLFLTRQHWRTTIGRMAEAMTVFSVMCAGLYPAIHVGRAWFDWFMFPVPNSNGLWPQFRSPLMWDVFAVNTYMTVSALFWFMGMIPDFGALRDRSTTRLRKAIFSFLAMGWTGSARHWHNYEKAYVVLSGLCTLLVFTVSSIVGLDFCTAQIAGWHATIFPLYFVIGAVFCGFGMVMVILIPLRKWCKLENVITVDHMDKVAKLALVAGLIIDYIYLMEFFIAWYSGDPYERWVFGHRLFGHTYMVFGWMLIGINVCVTQLLWFKKIRRNMKWLFIIGILINIGMWTERFVIVVGSLYQDFLPANWSKYWPTWVDIGTYIGTLGVFFTMYLLFVKFLPMIAISEVKGVTPQGDPHHPLGGAGRRPQVSKVSEQLVSEKLYGIMAEFDTPADVLHAAEKVRDAGYRRWDVFTPFPIHGLDKVMGLKNSLVGWVSLAMGGGAFLSGFGLLWFANAFDYPVIVGGKPMFSVPMSFVPSYILMVMGGAVGALVGMLALNQLPRLHHPLLNKERFALVTRDKFVLVIGATDPNFSVTETRTLLEAIGGKQVDLVEDND